MEVFDEVRQLKRTPRSETENLYRDREIRHKSSRRSSERRTSDYKRYERYRPEESDPQEWKEVYSEPESTKKTIRRIRPEEEWEENLSTEPRKKPRSYKAERDYYERSLKEHRYYQEEEPEEVLWRGNSGKTKKKHKKRGFGKALLCIILILAVAIGVIWAVPSWRSATAKAVLKSPAGPFIGSLFIGGNYNRYVKDKSYDRKQVRIHDGAEVPDGNITIALFGIDSRVEDITSGTMADSIMAVNIDKDGNIKMASVFRDTYLMSRTEDGEEIISKANSAFFRTGPLGAVNMLNENFDLAIKDYVVVNFWGMANIVDMLGGIRLTVTEEEREELNFHMHELYLYQGVEYYPLETSGESVLLTGNQATSFCRLRKTPFDSPVDGVHYTDDYGRAARQRYVLMELLRQVKEQGILKLMQLSNKLFAANAGEQRFIQSSMSAQDLVRLFARGYDMKIEGNEGFPKKELQYNAMLDSGDTIVADTLEENVVLMHEFLYGISGYEPTNGLREVADRIRAEVARQLN